MLITTMKIYFIFRFLLLFFSFLICLISFTQLSYAISLDSTFGVNGKIITSFNQDSFVSNLTLKDDKIIVVGKVSNGQNFDWGIAKYNIDGSLDTNFGNNGKILKNLGVNDAIETVITQPDGRILVGGYSQPSGNYLWTLARYNSDGTQDNSFGTNGFITTSFNSNLSLIKKVRLQTDEKIVAIGYVNNGSNDDVSVARYNADGSLDNTFGNNGIITTPIGGNNDRGTAGVLQPDGKIVVFGDYDAGGHDAVFLLRFNSNGTLDNSFGTNGKVVTQIGNYDGARDILLQSDGKIVITGGTNNPSPKMYLARYDSNGTLDATFGIGGKVIGSFVNTHTSNTSLLLEDGKILVGGYENTGGIADFVLYRFNADGSLDTSFGTNGSFITSLGSGSDEIRSIALQNDGKIVAAGIVSNSSYNDWGLARFANEDNALAVPLLKQTSNPWQSQTYDTANVWNPIDPTINAWGCALTSAAMVLKFHGINKMLDGVTDLDPGTLNTWLNSQEDGYVGNGLINWLAISRFSKLARGINGVLSYDALEYNRIEGADTTQLGEDLNNNIPGILEEPGHFIVAKGITQTSFSINDPFYDDRPTLASYSGTFLSLGRFVPSLTDLSYIMIVLDTNIQGNLKDAANNPVGTSFIQNPIINPLNPSSSSSPAKRIIYLPKPDTGLYDLILSSNTNTTYSAKIFLYDENGNVSLLNPSGVLGNENTDTIKIDFHKNGNTDTATKRTVTFQSTIDDIIALRNLTQIKKEKLKTDLIKLVQKAEGIVNAAKFKKNELKQKFNDFEKNLKKNRGKDMTEDAYQILLYDLQFLRKLYL